MNSSEDFHRNENGWQISVIIVPALLSASTLLSVVFILWRLFWRKREKKPDAGDARDGDWAVNMGGVYDDPLGAPDPTLEIKQLPRDWRIEDRAVLCVGHFGPISRAVLVGKGEERREVILKELSESCSPGEVQDFMDLLKFYNEVCDHGGVVRMLWCQTEAPPTCLIMEAMTLGNLLLFLRESHEEGVTDPPSAVWSITERDVFSMATQVAGGLEYLGGAHGLVHGYVAACNVLLHEDMSVRLCGLGLASVQHRTGSFPTRRAARVPVKWQSPERLREASVTEKSDVWSFGIFLYEMVTLGAPPYPDVDPAKIPKTLKKNYKMAKPRQCGERLYDVMTSCWQWEELKRPCFTDLLKQLQSFSAEADGSAPLGATDTLSWAEYLRVAGIPS
ncbi:tyrosine-protein kinase STYK1-like isoform X2 [Rana temporaria]|uniref:tyrosine-protein kinase STYK1-like isoform X2 n=1 Tax=Rana temporaria TaxID=8407 RepID=UPI001AACB280|nr:tyrosine-protein kinase STYK1-like isoform X2 [Rana temporaria]